jgi:hypothetical protein
MRIFSMELYSGIGWIRNSSIIKFMNIMEKYIFLVQVDR